MRVAHDVQNLFDRFDGDAVQYRNIRREVEAQTAALRWPLLGRLSGFYSPAFELDDASMADDVAAAAALEREPESEAALHRDRAAEALALERGDMDMSLLKLGLNAAALAVGEPKHVELVRRGERSERGERGEREADRSRVAERERELAHAFRTLRAEEPPPVRRPQPERGDAQATPISDKAAASRAGELSFEL